MHKTTFLPLLLVAAATTQAMPTLTVGDVTYENVSLKKEYPRSFFIKHSSGTAFVDKSKLTEEQTAEILQAPSQPQSATAGLPAESTGEESAVAAATDPDVLDSSEGLFVQPTPETLDNEEERKFFEACGQADTQTILTMLQENPALAKVTMKGQTYRMAVPPHLNGGKWGYKAAESTHSALQWLIDRSEKTPGRIEAIKALIEAGADLNAATSEKGTNCARNFITNADYLLPDELDYLLTKGADPHFGWCVGGTMPLMNLALGYLREKDPQKKSELAELLRVYAKHKVDLGTEGGYWGGESFGRVNSAKQVVELSQDQELAAIFAGN